MLIVVKGNVSLDLLVGLVGSKINAHLPKHIALYSCTK